jgi:hypothetical protein
MSAQEPAPVVAPSARPAAAPAADLRARVAYLKAIRALMAEASDSRKTWIRRVGVLIVDARTGPPGEIAPAAGLCGAEQRSAFASVRERVSALDVPPGCEECGDAFLAWLDKHLLACPILTEIAQSQDVLGLRSVQRVLAEARADGAAFSGAYAALVAPLRARAAAARTKKKRPARWPFLH